LLSEIVSAYEGATDSTKTTQRARSLNSLIFTICFPPTEIQETLHK